MANIPSSTEKNNLDLVKRNEVLKSLVILEEKARNTYLHKWGFLLDFDKFVLEEARKNGVSEEEYRRWTVRRKSRTKALDAVYDLKMTEGVPETSSGLVGWRSAPEHALERMGPLYSSPLHTLPPKERISSILLG